MRNVMGLVFKMIVPILVMLLVYGYMMGGQKMLDFMESAPPKLKGIEGLGNAVTDEKVTVYQWVDEKGGKHFSNTPPAGVSADQLNLSSKTNVIQSIPTPADKEQNSGAQVTSIPSNPYSPGGAKKMIDGAKNLKNMMDQRAIDQQKMLDKISGKSH